MNMRLQRLVAYFILSSTYGVISFNEHIGSLMWVIATIVMFGFTVWLYQFQEKEIEMAKIQEV